MLSVVLGMTRAETGWIRQTPALADRLQPVPGLISEHDIGVARTDWDVACETFHKHARHRIKEIQRVARIHRDPFEPILPVLESDSPVGEYRKITEEIVRLMPDERRYPRAAAEAVRSFLLLRLGMHLGLRQRNLRELLVCPRGRVPTSERHLEDKKRGELRWSDRDHGWEVLIPAVAFKNSTSSFFGSKPFRLVLPDLAGLYDMIEAYLEVNVYSLPNAPEGNFFALRGMRNDLTHNMTSGHIQPNCWVGRGTGQVHGVPIMYVLANAPDIDQHGKQFKHPYVERFYIQQRDAAVIYRDLMEELALTADHTLQWLANRLEQRIVRYGA